MSLGNWEMGGRVLGPYPFPPFQALLGQARSSVFPLCYNTSQL